MEIIEVLMAEHCYILKRLEDFKEQLNNKRCTKDDINYHLDFIRVYVDGYHHEKEELALFPWMQQKSPNLKHGPLSVMLSDHSTGRSSLKTCYELTQGVKKKVPKELFQSLTREVNHFFDHISAHIQKEDHVLYKIAEDLNQIHHDGDDYCCPILEEIETRMKDDIRRFISPTHDR